jgi:hypothetical protein
MRPYASQLLMSFICTNYRNSLLLLAAIAGSTLGNSAYAALIVERPLGVDRNQNIFTTTQFDLEIAHFGGSFSSPVNLFKVVESGITTADANKSFTLDSGPLFDSVVARLTDGVDEFIRIRLTERSSGRAETRGFKESGFFAGFSSLPGPDLATANINSIELRINHFLLSSAPANPFAVTLLPVDLSMTFTVQGEVIPEPTTETLAALGLALAASAAYTVGGKRRRAVAAAAIRHP